MNEINQNKILIIEDNLETAYLVKEYLADCNFNVTIFSTVTDAISSMKFTKYDLILLDLNLPDFNGVEVLKYLNKSNITIPVIVLSAHSEISTKIEAFKLGIVDYVVKPANLEELEARIWVHLRKNTYFETENEKKLFHFENDKILFMNQPLKLTKIEFDILHILLKNQNNLILREDLVKSLSSSASIRSLDYHIRNIRKKINDNGSNPKYLVTEYSMGYKLIN